MYLGLKVQGLGSTVIEKQAGARMLAPLNWAFK